MIILLGWFCRGRPKFAFLSSRDTCFDWLHLSDC